MTDVLELSDGRGHHAGGADVEEGNDPGRRDVDDVAAERGERVRSCGAGIDHGRRPGAQAMRIRLDPVVSRPPEDVDMEVDQTRQDQPVAGVDDLLSRRRGEPVIELGHQAAGHPDVAATMESLTGVDDGATADQHIRATHPQPLPHRLSVIARRS
jgi:hypothetical protein